MIAIIYDFETFSDKDYLELMNILDAKGYFDKY